MGYFFCSRKIMRSKLQWDNFLQRKNNTKYDQPLPPLKLQSTFRGTKLLGIRVRGENYLELELDMFLYSAIAKGWTRKELMNYSTAFESHPVFVYIGWHVSHGINSPSGESVPHVLKASFWGRYQVRSFRMFHSGQNVRKFFILLFNEKYYYI